MTRFDTLREFLGSQYRNWVPDASEAFGREFTESELESPCLFAAYTDYGGDFLDRVTCQYILQNAADETHLTQSTVYFGRNLLYFGQLPDSDYPLATFPGMPDFEEFYTEAEYEAARESFENFCEWELGCRAGKRRRLKEWAMGRLMSERGYGYYAPQSDGTIDFCSSDLLEWLFSETRVA